MDPIVEFSMRATLFMAVFLVIVYFMFRHIERIKNLHGEPKNKENYIAVLKYFFVKKSNKSSDE